MSIRKSNKIIVILGPTAGGKTGLAVKLAHKYNGEVVSADSRQVYKGMDIGTGKDLDEYEFTVRGKKVKIPYHMIDVVSPKTEYSLAKFQKQAFKAIDDILDRGKLPIVAGGTGLYLQAIVDNYQLSSVKANKELRERLEKESVEQVFAELKKIAPAFAKRLNQSEQGNKRRLIRYIEVMEPSKKAGRHGTWNMEQKKKKKDYKFLILGITWPKDILRERIYKRLVDRLENEDMVGEVERLHKEGVSWKRLEKFGLEYKFISLYLQGKLEYEEMVEQLNIASRQFAKRQMTWFRRWEKQGRKIKWVKTYKESRELVEKFLKR